MHWGCETHGSPVELLADPEISDLQPVAQSFACSAHPESGRAGAQLCEKPIASSAEEAQRLRASWQGADHAAFMVRFHPQWLRARELVRQGLWHPTRGADAFSYFNADPKTSATAPTSAAARCTTSAVMQSWPVGISSRRNPSASSRW
jgi:hypothetical protein